MVSCFSEAIYLCGAIYFASLRLITELAFANLICKLLMIHSVIISIRGFICEIGTDSPISQVAEKVGRTKNKCLQLCLRLFLMESCCVNVHCGRALAKAVWNVK